MQLPPAPSGQQRSSPWWLLPLGLLALGMVLAAWGCTSAVQRALPLFSEEPSSVNDPVERELVAATWAVYANGPLTARSITVTSSDGSDVPVRVQSRGVNESVSRPAGEFVVVAKFDVATAGVHQLVIDSSQPSSTQILLGPPVLDVFSVSGRAAAMIVGGLFLIIGGAVLWYRRTRS